jgi:hypothetical protein
MKSSLVAIALLSTMAWAPVALAQDNSTPEPSTNTSSVDPDDGPRDHHVSLGAAATPYIAASFDRGRGYVGIMLLPDVKYSYSLGSRDRGRFYAGFRWSGFSTGAGTSLAKEQAPADNITNVEGIINAGFLIRTSRHDNSTKQDLSWSVPWFSVGGFVGNFRTKDDVLITGAGVLIGLELDALSLNLGG